MNRLDGLEPIGKNFVLLKIQAGGILQNIIKSVKDRDHSAHQVLFGVFPAPDPFGHFAPLQRFKARGEDIPFAVAPDLQGHLLDRKYLLEIRTVRLAESPTGH
jgi:hypothetical protein